MKKIFILFSIFLGTSVCINAQSKIHQAGHEVKKGAKKVGNKTAELASKGKSKVVDKTIKEKQGPNGETIYMDDHDRYYWVDKKGRKKYSSYSSFRSRN